jgi:hypothetical protein
MGGDYIKAIIPFGKIYNKKKWSDIIHIIDMNQEEIAEFNGERKGKFGTTVGIPTTDKIIKAVDDLFVNFKSIPVKERLDVTLGRFDTKFSYKKRGEEIVNLKMWNQFADENFKYYKGKREIPIIVYQNMDKKDIFFVADLGSEGLRHFASNRRGCNTEESVFVKRGRDEKIAVMTFHIAHRKDKTYFDPDFPKIPDGKGVAISDFEKKWFSEKDNEELAKTTFVRNTMQFGSTALEPWGTYRTAGVAGRVHEGVRFRTKTELRFETFSSQDSKMDEILNIQSVKNQWDETTLPKPLRRLCKFLKEKIKNENLEYFRELTHNADKKRTQFVLKLQALWRGRQARALFPKIKAVIKIQSTIRMFLKKPRFHDASDTIPSDTSDDEDGSNADDTPNAEDDRSKSSNSDSSSDGGYSGLVVDDPPPYCVSPHNEIIEEEVTQVINNNRLKIARELLDKLFEDKKIEQAIIALEKIHADKDELCTHGNMRGECSQADCEN